MATLAVGSTTIDTRTYDDGGSLTASSYNNGASESRAYNTDTTLASISFTGAAIGDLSYGWDESKNKTSETIGGTMSGYGFAVGSSGYDDEDRLVNWERSDTNLDQSWNLSAVGNWTSITENASPQNRTHGPTHELLTVATQSVTHDAKGNMPIIPAVLRPGSDPLKMKWDFENKLIAADTDDDSMDDIFYKFDALGRRVGRDDGTANVVYFQDGQQTIADYPSGTDATTPTYTYVYASYIDEPVMRGGSGGLRYYHRNQQYSITAISDGGGAVVERYAYSAYGQVTIADASGSQISNTAISNRYTYTGREWDEGLSLYHYRARMYDAVSGRFVSRDPIGFDGGGLNLFQYVCGWTTKAVDPHGKIVLVGTVVVYVVIGGVLTAIFVGGVLKANTVRRCLAKLSVCEIRAAAGSVHCGLKFDKESGPVSTEDMIKCQDRNFNHFSQKCGRGFTKCMRRWIRSPDSDFPTNFSDCVPCTKCPDDGGPDEDPGDDPDPEGEGDPNGPRLPRLEIDPVNGTPALAV